MDFSQFAHVWILFSLASAFFHASRLAVTKHLSLDFSTEFLTFYVNLSSLLITLPLIIWHHRFPFHDPVYLFAVVSGGLFSALGGWALNAALHKTDVSLVGPLMTLTPGFAILIEWLVAGALPASIGLLGVLLLVVGGYVLSLGDHEVRWYLPFRRIMTDPGSVLTLLAGGCFAAASVIGRIGIQLSDPLSFAVVVAIVNPLILFVIFSVRDRSFYRQIKFAVMRRHARPLLILGALFAAMRIADQIALSLTLASYAMAVKRTAGLFSVALGRWFFKETHPLVKSAGAVIMLFGVLVLTLK
ncbi:EamA family transporter [Thiocapsa imhoffii]|uniref:EamA family transporter n=1 Tax=Thiocapsa imhoffii TaxID=382777 RepID=A0A9X0WGF0_9GAMM|nr:DMT family transporter [Thiocapsa imhoffii]MBK1644020.1 EamA family transporter [Thiocapsa imhoffii]